VQLLKKTKLDGDASFLTGLDPEQVVKELFNYDLVRRAIESSGGMAGFDGIEPGQTDPMKRVEQISFLDK
jgi:hypothetical protein